MERTVIRDLRNNLNNTVKLQGWVHRIRKLGKLAFLILRDRTGLVQCVVNTKAIDIKGLKIESIVELTGEVQKKESSETEVEIWVQSLTSISNVYEDLPIEINKEELEANIDTILNNRVLSLRNPRINAVFKIQAALAQGFQAFLSSEEFTQV
jgi:nondiscriminating aspartyl-tRNA synthetase